MLLDAKQTDLPIRRKWTHLRHERAIFAVIRSAILAQPLTWRNAFVKLLP
jgi:hypothetical protein